MSTPHIPLKKFPAVSMRGLFTAFAMVCLLTLGGKVLPVQANPNADAPAAFGKTSPADGTDLLPPPDLTLQWEASAGADSYEICIQPDYSADDCYYSAPWQSAASGATSFAVSNLD